MKVGVLLPTYNRTQEVNGVSMLERSILSFLGQDYHNSELLILNDASTDHTREVLRKYERHDRIHIFHSDTNMGPPVNQNRLWDMADGDLVCQLHDDDELTTDGLGLRVKEFYKDTSLQVVYGGAILQNINGDRQGLASGQAPDKDRILREEYINFVTLMYRRDLPFRFEESLRYYFDWLFKIRCLNECRVGYVPDPVIRYTMHPGQESNKCRRENANEPQERMMREKLKEYGYR